MIRRSAVLFGAALAGCAASAPSLGPAMTNQPSTFSLAGRWQVIAVNGRPVAGVARFEPPRFSITFGCNDGRGQYRQEDDTLVVEPPLGTTERGCMNADDGPSDVMQHEDEGFRIAARPMRIAFYGPSRVRLTNEAGTIDLSR